MEKMKFKEIYLSMYVLKNKVKVKHGNIVCDNFLYSFIGIDINGNRDFLNMFLWKDDNRFFLDIFETFKHKGIKKIYFCIVSNEPKLQKALAISFPNCQLIPNLTTIISNLYAYTSYRGRNTLVHKLKELYVQNTYNDMTGLFEYFKEFYQGNTIVNTLFKKYCSDIKSYYCYDLEVRNFLFNHYSFTHFFDKIKSISNDFIITNEDDIKLKLQDTIDHMETSRLYNKGKWSIIINHCSNYFEEIIEEVTKSL